MSFEPNSCCSETHLMYDLLSGWSPFPETSWICFLLLCLSFWHLYWACSLTWWKIETKTILHPFAIENISWILFKIFHSLLKWESLPASGVTMRFFVNKSFTNGWICFILFNKITSAILLEKVLFESLHLLVGYWGKLLFHRCCCFVCIFHLFVKRICSWLVIHSFP